MEPQAINGSYFHLYVVKMGRAINTVSNMTMGKFTSRANAE